MDILVTAEGEVAAVDAQIAAHGSGGYQLSTGAIYPPGLTLAQDVTIPSELVGKRLSYVAGVFSELPDHPKQVPVPQSVDRLKAVALLDQMGLGAAYLAWCKSPARTMLEQEMLICTRVWERSNPTLVAAATAMGLTSAQLDQMFIQIGY